MSNDKPLQRYEPEGDMVDGEFIAVMGKSDTSGWINEDELRERLNQMLAEACDPGEKDALNSVLKLINTPNW